MTWYKLWRKIGKQPLKKTMKNKVVVYHQGMLYEAMLKYTNNGNYFYIETTNEAIRYDE